jgi:hypothetical protein
LLYHQWFSIPGKGYLAEHFYGLFGLLIIFHDDETKTTAFSRLPVHGHFCRYHLAEFFKNFFEFSIIDIIGKASNKQSHKKYLCKIIIFEVTIK